MGRPLTTILSTLPPADVAVLDAYAAALRHAGISTAVYPCRQAGNCVAEGAGASPLGQRLRAARRFLERWGLAGWRQLPVAEQVAVLTRLRPPALATNGRTFVCWLALTGRLPFPSALLEALEEQAPTSIHWLEQGRLAWPALIARLEATADKLGYRPATAAQVAAAVTKAAAYAGKPPEALTLAEIVSLSEAMRQRRVQRQAARGQPLRRDGNQPLIPWTTGSVLYHAGLLPEPPDTRLIARRATAGVEASQLGFLQAGWPALHDVARCYLAQRRRTRRESTVTQEALALGRFFRWLTTHHPAVTTLHQLDRRTHLEPFLSWLQAETNASGQPRWSLGTRHTQLTCLARFFRLLAQWGWPEAPARPVLLSDDLPRLPAPLPKAFDDVEAARMVQLARTAPDPLSRLIIELLAGGGLRVGEARDLRLSDLVTFGGPAGHPGAQVWLRVPVGKLANDRYVPVSPELQAALDAFLAAERSSREWEGHATPPGWTAYLLARRGRRLSRSYCNQVVQRVAAQAGAAPGERQ
jgi:integrase